MLLLRYMAPAVPAALLVMAMATIVIGLLGGEATGVHVAGHIPSGLPHLTLPNLDATILYELAPGALAIVLVGYAEALGAAKAAAMQSGGDIDPNQELVAHGPANILSGLFGGFLVVGSLSMTSVAMAAGARSQVANLVAAAFCLFTLILLTPLFRNMPQPALAAIVIAAMLHLTKPRYLRDLFARNRWSFANAVHRSRGRGVESVAGCAGREAGASGFQSGQLHRHQCKRRVVRPHQRAKKPRYHPCVLRACATLSETICGSLG